MTKPILGKEVGWNFDNSYARLPEQFYTKLPPTPVHSPKLVLLNERLAQELGMNVDAFREEENIQVLAGNRIPDQSQPIAQAYAGHQFGHFTMLGDGRAILLGEHVTPEGKRVDIQLKGSGKTPFSRGGDGRAALGPMLREYIISEAMHGLGIPTTRSLAVVTTGEKIYREEIETGAILTRVASSHLRVGTFQYAARWTTKEHLQALADYALERHCLQAELEQSENRYLYLLEEVTRRQAKLIAQWQLCGFVHGVMNTDNMTISGETIDYGPCAFMDVYDPLTVFSSIDHHGRYAYGNQPQIAQWNLARFAESLLPIIDDPIDSAIEKAEPVIARFPDLYKDHWLAGMRAKLGLFDEDEGDEALIEDLLQLMHQHRADYTNTFLALTTGQDYGVTFLATSQGMEWIERWEKRRDNQKESKEQSERLMKEHNPAVIPRNHRVEEALQAAVQEGDLNILKKLLNVLENPYAYSSEQVEYAEPPPRSMLPYRTFCGT